jgi:serine protease Do
MKMKPVAAALVVAGVVIAASGAGAWGVGEMLERRPAVAIQSVSAALAGSTAPAAIQAAPAPGSAAPITVAGYREIVQAYGPAVVGITVAGARKAGVEDEPEDVPQYFRGLPGMPFGGPRGDAPFRGQGSGFIISADGLILTNAHVVRGASEVTVKLSDRREFRAKVLGADGATDVAVLKVDATNLPAVALGDANRYRSATRCSRSDRRSASSRRSRRASSAQKGARCRARAYVPFIQTDAAVNPGNSGRPAVRRQRSCDRHQLADLLA